jgi:hypothetical protein
MSERDLALEIIAAVRSRDLPKRAAYVAVCTACAEGGGLRNYRNDGSSTLNDAFLHRQLNDSERAVARQSLAYGDGPIGRNLDSMGLYQQRPMSGWGAPAELMDPATSAGKFLDGAGNNRGLTDIHGWEQMEIYAAGQKVQGSLEKDAWLYQSWQAYAVNLVDSLWSESASSAATNPSSYVDTLLGRK